ncbi:MAG: DUF4198 domain-containing protein [Planctomycetaceae bacterium]|jgi:hypothetical protein|nr:DUF4198 domain-containing protein [Planctomycetaceae bacterium]
MKYITNYKYSAVIIALSTLMLFNGCGRSGHEIYPATGKILYNGKPLDGAQVSFHPHDPSGFVAVAITKADGTFSLLTTGAEKNGAIAGDYDVLISKVIIEDDIAPTTNIQQEQNPKTSIMETPANPQNERRPTMTSVIPEKYAQPDKPLFKATVAKKQNNNYLFELDDK